MALPHSKDPLKYPARFQWQSGAPCGGSSCCTDTVIQMIVEYYKEKTYSLSYIRRVAQAKTRYDEKPCTGINYVEVLNALKALGVTHYRVGWGVDANTVATKTRIGPTLVGVYYGSYPKYTSGRCGTPKAEHGGKTDCPFRGAHAVLAIRKQAHKNSAGKVLHYDMVTRDPNHHHGSIRPEAPSFDRMTMAQFNKTMKDLVPYTAFTRTYCIYPTLRK